MKINPNLTSNSYETKTSTGLKEKVDGQRDQVTLGAQIQDDAILMGDKVKDMQNRGGGGNGNAVTAVLDIRVPTTTKEITEERRQKILDTIQPGDIILETNNAYPGWQRMEMLTMRCNYTHAAIYEGDGKFLEATTGDPSGKGVVRSDLKEYLHGPLLMEIIRPDYKTPEDRKAALDYCRSQLGKPYDSQFNMEDDKSIYCAELVQRALAAMPNKMDVPLSNFLGRKAVGPDNFEKMEGAEVVYSDKSNFWKNMLTHYPVALGALPVAAAGAMALGPFGAIAGFAGGLLLSIATGNKIQTGTFGFWA